MSAPPAAPSTAEIQHLMQAFNQARDDAVIALSADWARRYPAYAFGWTAHGTALYRAGRSHQAIVPLQQATALAPADASAHNNLGNVLDCWVAIMVAVPHRGCDRSRARARACCRPPAWSRGSTQVAMNTSNARSRLSATWNAWPTCVTPCASRCVRPPCAEPRALRCSLKPRWAACGNTIGSGRQAAIPPTRRIDPVMLSVHAEGYIRINLPLSLAGLLPAMQIVPPRVTN